MHEAEWLTRKKRIDTKLKSLDWKIIPYTENLDFSSLTHHAVEELPTHHGFADYALFVDGKLLGFIEAKKVSVNPQNVLEQAKRYSKTTFQGVGNWNGFRVPFLYATNGEVIWFADVRHGNYNARRLSQFHTPNALKEFFLTDKTAAFDWLKNNPVEQISRLRYYQRDAISSIETELNKNRREMLIAMATGTGKTLSAMHTILTKINKIG